MSEEQVIVRATAAYVAYSWFMGRVVLPAFPASREAAFDTAWLVQVLSGPGVGLAGGHGVEVWLFASIVCLPLLWGALLAGSPTGRWTCAAALVALWSGTGLLL